MSNNRIIKLAAFCVVMAVIAGFLFEGFRG